MKLFSFEIKKVLCRRSFVVIVVICVTVNLLLQVFPGTMSASYTPQSYVELMEDLSGMSAKEAWERVNETQRELEEFLFRSLTADEEESGGQFAPYTGDIWTEKELLDDVLSELDKVVGYQDYLEQIQEDAAKMMEVYIFRKSTGFSEKNIEKTAEDFAGLTDVAPEWGVSRGVIMAAGQTGTDYIMVFFLAALCFFLIFAEKQSGLLMLTAPAEKGRQWTVAVKIGVMLVIMIVFMAVLYGGNFFLAGKWYGFGDLSRPIQSVGAYQSCILKISVGQYLGLFLGMKILLYFVFGLLFFVICLLGKKLIRIVSVCIALLGGSEALCILIPENSTFMALRYLNLMYFLKTDRLLTVYKNVNLMGYPVSLLNVCVWLLSIAAVCLVCLSIHTARGSRFLQTADERNIFRRKKFRYHVRSVLGFEYQKLMIKSGVVWMLLLFVAIQIYRIQDYSYFDQADDIYYKKYMDFLSGPITERTTAYVEEENERYAALYAELYETEDISRQSEIGQELLPANAWERVVSEYERISEIKDPEGLELSMVFPEGYYMLMGQDEQRDLVCGSLFNVLLCLCMMYVFAVDTGIGMDKLIRTSFRGRKDTMRAKKKISFLAAVSVFVLVYGADFVLIWLKIGLKEWGASIQSLQLFSDCVLTINLWQYVLLLYSIKFVGMWVSLCGIRLLSCYCKDIFQTLLVSSVVFVLPGLLGLLGLEAVNYISLIPLLNANQILNGILFGTDLLYAVSFGIVAIVIIVLSQMVLSGKFCEISRT